MTTSANEWQRVIKMIMSGSKWQRVIKRMKLMRVSKIEWFQVSKWKKRPIWFLHNFINFFMQYIHPAIVPRLNPPRKDPRWKWGLQNQSPVKKVWVFYLPGAYWQFESPWEKFWVVDAPHFWSFRISPVILLRQSLVPG